MRHANCHYILSVAGIMRCTNLTELQSQREGQDQNAEEDPSYALLLSTVLPNDPAL